jgi:hypothetical protein
MADTRKCTASDAAGRLEKARQFLDAADAIDVAIENGGDLSDAYVTLCVHAGIAAADALCCARLGVHATGPDHSASAALLGRIDKSLAKNLQRLLGLKTKAGYSSAPSSATDRRMAGRTAARLVEAASII